MKVIDKVNVHSENQFKHVTEASTAGFAPGFWPTEVAVLDKEFMDAEVFHNPVRYEDADGDITVMVYTNRNNRRNELHVIND